MQQPLHMFVTVVDKNEGKKNRGKLKKSVAKIWYERMKKLVAINRQVVCLRKKVVFLYFFDLVKCVNKHEHRDDE